MPSASQRLVHDSVFDAGSASAGKDAIVDEYTTRTHGQLLDDSLRFARALQDAGLEQGERVALYLDNTAQCAAAIFGTLIAGGAFTFVNPQTKAEKLSYILNNSEAKFLVAEAHSAGVAARAVAEAASVRHVYATAGSAVPPEFSDLGETMRASAPEPKTASTTPEDLAALVYTSGTTGEPKGVMHSHGALAFSVDSIAQYLRLGADDRILNVLPMAFTYGLSQLLLTVRLGATLLLERSFAFPAKTLSRMRNQDATVFPAVPTVYATILGLAKQQPFPSVRCLTNAAAGLPPAMHGGLRELFPNAALFRMYCQTECVRVCYLEPELIDEKPTSVGRAIPGTEAFVLNEDGERVQPGDVGVLHVRGPHLMSGYWRAPDLTAEKLVPSPDDPHERILSTQDHFTVDEDGDLYFVGRSDDIIKTRGEKVSSVEVENALHTVPGIKQAAVIGVPDDLLGHALRAYVVLQEGAALSEREIIKSCHSRLENFMVPREVMFVSELPQTDSGKVRKKSLLPG